MQIISQSEVIFIVYSEPVESEHVKINFSYWQHIQNVNIEKTEKETSKTN